MGWFLKGKFAVLQKKKSKPQECTTCLLFRAESDICEASRFKIPYTVSDACQHYCSFLDISNYVLTYFYSRGVESNILSHSELKVNKNSLQSKFGEEYSKEFELASVAYTDYFFSFQKH